MFQKQLASNDTGKVLVAFRAMKKHFPHELSLHIQKLLRHGDPRVRLQAKSFLEKIDPADFLREFSLLLRSPDDENRKEAIRIAFLTEGDLVAPQVVAAYRRETNALIRTDMETFFEGNPSFGLLKILIPLCCLRSAEQLIPEPILERVYASLKSISEFPLKPLPELLKEFYPPPEKQLTKEVRNLRASIENYHLFGKLAEKYPHLNLAEEFVKGFLANKHWTIAFFLITIFVMVMFRLVVSPVNSASVKGKPLRLIFSHKEVSSQVFSIEGVVASVDSDGSSCRLRTSSGTFEVTGRYFSLLRKGEKKKMLVRSKKIHSFGVPRFDFVSWPKEVEKPKESAPQSQPGEKK